MGNPIYRRRRRGTLIATYISHFFSSPGWSSSSNPRSTHCFSSCISCSNHGPITTRESVILIPDYIPVNEPTIKVAPSRTVIITESQTTRHVYIYLISSLRDLHQTSLKEERGRREGTSHREEGCFLVYRSHRCTGPLYAARNVGLSKSARSRPVSHAPDLLRSTPLSTLFD